MTDHMDVRIRERYVRRGVITRKDLEAHDAALPDLAEKVEMIDYERRFAEEAASPKPPPRAAQPAAASARPAAVASAAPAAQSSDVADDMDDEDDEEEDDDLGDAPGGAQPL